VNDLEPFHDSARQDDAGSRHDAGGRGGSVFTFRTFGPGRLLGLLVPAGCAGVLLVVGLVFVFVLFVFRFLWAWTVPDLFPGAVAQGLIARELSWGAAFKLACVSAVISGFFRRR
jgi:hypothetical protein